MPAYFEDGFSVREPMWHGLGVTLEDYPSREEAFPVSGQDWTVEKAPLFTFEGSPLAEVDGYFGALRSDTRELLAVHQDSYEVLQNSEGWDLAEAIVDQDQALRFETAGVLKGGRVCWVLLKDEPFQVDGDDSKTIPYMLVSWAHDGTAAMVATATNIRVVCWNTLSFALEGGKQQLKFRHTRNVRDRIEDAKRAVSRMRENTLRYRNLARALAKSPVDSYDIRDFTREFLPIPFDAKPAVLARVQNNRDELNRILTGATTVNADSGAYTAYDLLQAGVEYLDYSKAARSDETRFNRTFLTSNDPKQALLTAVCDLVGV